MQTFTFMTHTHSQPVVLSIMSSYCEHEGAKYLLQCVLEAKIRSLLHLGHSIVCICVLYIYMRLYICCVCGLHKKIIRS